MLNFMCCKKSNLIRKKEKKEGKGKKYIFFFFFFRYIRYNLFIHSFDRTIQMLPLGQSGPCSNI